MIATTKAYQIETATTTYQVESGRSHPWEHPNCAKIKV